MHLCKVTLKSGTVYDGVLVIGNPLATLLRDDPYVRVLTFQKEGALNVPLNEIESAVTEGERISISVLGDKDELPDWSRFHEIYVSNKERLDGLPERERISEAEVLYYALPRKRA
ncbi:Uncharacterised protein [uncultured archaeon]|nr:Uncharacterised protein [uncultured archaeon]